jgi:glucose/mannose-6-phosphate isomerase
VAVSYSGNTAETVSAVEQGLAAGARLVAVTSGGSLAELASARGAPLVTIEGGRMPRAALWSLVVPVCSAAEAAGVLPPLTDQVHAAADALDEEAAALGPAVTTAANPAKQAALRLLDRLPVVWGSGQVGAVAATRFRTQCNENAKVSVVSGALPEANHNDVMGLEGGTGPGRELVLLRDEAGEHDRDGRRIQAVLKAIGARDPVVRSAGKGPDLARLARLTAFADFTSTYLGIARGLDPTPIRTLDEVKAALSAETDPPR